MMMRSINLWLALAAVHTALAANMDNTGVNSYTENDPRGDPMCCATSEQCIIGSCNHDDIIKTSIPGPINMWRLSCADSGSMPGWCDEMETPEPDDKSGGESGAGGDPHFKSWSGEWFDFHGACDLVLLNAPSFHNGLGLQVQIRTHIRHERYSHISRAALKIGDDVLEVAGWGDYSLMGIQNAQLPQSMAGFTVSLEKQEAKETILRIHLKDSNQESIEVKTFKDMVNVKFNDTTAKDFGDSFGILGSYEQGYPLARDGRQVMKHSDAFAMEWQVRPEVDGMLFEQPREPQYPVQCLLPQVKAEQRRKLRGGLSEEDAEGACEQFADKDAKARCVFDVLATQDLEVAAGAF